ncbi:hypothetical protein C2G38_2049316 [Gigaspora rosea]|uniref:MD-2-related lipid-recognition domain-containing protein n=1 Tax=Gigaspora rosea TaxID=44941 RepID=A0A397TZF0_9GLOM|nr:hypothetical protein C2G38_2049316 [Gigaspora rosea]
MKNFIFTFILFVLLLTVNVAPFQLNKRAITFKPCISLKLTVDVEIGPNPPESGKSESFNVSGSLMSPITNNTTLIITYSGINGGQIGDKYFQNFTHSIIPGTPFEISASDVPTPELPDTYLLEVEVGERIDSGLVTYACAVAEVATVSVSFETSKIFDI